MRLCPSGAPFPVVHYKHIPYTRETQESILRKTGSRSRTAALRNRGEMVESSLEKEGVMQPANAPLKMQKSQVRTVHVNQHTPFNFFIVL